MTRIGIALPRDEDMPRGALLDLAKLAEAKGYESVWVPEAWGRDAATLATQIAMVTARIRIGTGIVTVFSRTPALLAQTAASLDEVSGGRLLLGLGTSGPIVIQNWHGMPFDRPIQRTREYVEIVRLAIEGKRVNYDGTIFHLRNFRLPFQPQRPRIPIYIAALSPRNLELTGELAEGWLPIFVSTRHMAVFTEHLRVGAQRAGREVSEIDVAPYIPALVGSAGDADAMLREHLAYYVGGMGDFYHNLVCRYGFAEAAATIKEAWAKAHYKAAVAAVTDEMMATLTISGTAAECRRRLEEFRAAGVTHPVLTFPHGVGPELMAQTIEAVAS